MINPHNVVNILVDSVSSRLTLNLTVSKIQRDGKVANMLFESVESIRNSVSYSFETYFTLGLGNIADVSDEMILPENGVSMKCNDDDDDDDDCGKSDDDAFTFDESFSIKNEKEDVIRNEFSLQFMANVANFFDEKDSTGKRKHNFRNVQRRFKRAKDRRYIRWYRIHIANDGTKMQKVNLIDSFVYETLSELRPRPLSVHGIDLKRWILEKAKDFFDTTFTASNHWVR